MNRDTRKILEKLNSPTIEIFEKIALVNVNKSKIDIHHVLDALKTSSDYITSPVKDVFDRIIQNNILSNQTV